jgi:uncharacterized protein (DUF924 family)
VSSTSPQPRAGEETASSVVGFWLGFDHGDPALLREWWRRWFVGDATLDREVEATFGGLVRRAASGPLSAWAGTSEGRLALILLLDQFPRNLYRGSAAAFAHDALALALAREGIALGADRELSQLARLFFYMPLQHAESATLQQESLDAVRALSEEPAPEHIRAALTDALRYAQRHADIIAEFGRFPHRNRSLGRASTAAEEAYLTGGGPTFGQ